MSSRVNIVSVRLLENPANPSDKIKLEIVFEIFESIKEDIEWELVFVGTDGREEHDQVLDSVLIGPIQEGRHKFTFEAPPPQIRDLRPEDFMDVTLLLLKCKYRDQLFMKIGWFVTHTYTDQELVDNPPPQPVIEKLTRTIVSEDVRVTSYPIKWDDERTQAKLKVGDLHFQILDNTPFGEVMKAYAEVNGVQLSELRFLYNGRRIEGAETPSSLMMEQEDTVEVFPTQKGGFGRTTVGVAIAVGGMLAAGAAVWWVFGRGGEPQNRGGGEPQNGGGGELQHEGGGEPQHEGGGELQHEGGGEPHDEGTEPVLVHEEDLEVWSPPHEPGQWVDQPPPPHPPPPVDG